jgi:hypothetical protein
MVVTSAPLALARTTEDMPICMRWIWPDVRAGPVSLPPIISMISASSPSAAYNPAAFATHTARKVLAGEAFPILKGMGSDGFKAWLSC